MYFHALMRVPNIFKEISAACWRLRMLMMSAVASAVTLTIAVGMHRCNKDVDARVPLQVLLGSMEGVVLYGQRTSETLMGIG